MKFKIIYEDNDLLVINKPAGIVVFPEDKITGKTLIENLIRRFPNLKKVGKCPRYGAVHRLDKETSGIFLVAKNNKTLELLQQQFQSREAIKKYLALVVGNLREEQGVIETLIGRSPKDGRKQKVYLPYEPASAGKRPALTEYKVLKRLKDYSLLEIYPKTGRKHQIRTHLSYLGHPIAGDKMYGFKNQICPKDLKRHFLHASYLKIQLKSGGKPTVPTQEFNSELPKSLKTVLNHLK